MALLGPRRKEEGGVDVDTAWNFSTGLFLFVARNIPNVSRQQCIDMYLESLDHKSWSACDAQPLAVLLYLSPSLMNLISVRVTTPVGYSCAVRTAHWDDNNVSINGCLVNFADKQTRYIQHASSTMHPAYRNPVAQWPSS